MRREPVDINGAARRAEANIQAKHKPSVKEKVVDEIKRFLLIAFYLWILLTLFVLQERIILAHENITRDFTSFGFAIVNALVLGKVVLIAEDLHFASRLDDRPLIFPTLFKSAAFGILCMGFYILEETLVGLWHGKILVESLPPIAQRGAKGVILAAITLSVEFIPLFAVRELGRVLGGRELRSLFFKRRSAPG